MCAQIHPNLAERYQLAWESAALFLTGKSHVQLLCEAGEALRARRRARTSNDARSCAAESGRTDICRVAPGAWIAALNKLVRTYCIPEPTSESSTIGMRERGGFDIDASNRWKCSKSRSPVLHLFLQAAAYASGQERVYQCYENRLTSRHRTGRIIRPMPPFLLSRRADKAWRTSAHFTSAAFAWSPKTEMEKRGLDSPG
jgi:hypothetical protein